MVIPACRIVFTSPTSGERIVLYSVHEISTDSTWERLTDTAVVKIPRLLQWQGRPVASGTDSIIRRGMKVEIYMGMGEIPDEPEFTGYVAAPKVGNIVQVNCEDEMWPLKQKLFKVAYPKKVYTKLPLKRLLDDLLGAGVPYKLNLDVDDLGNWEIAGKPNAAQVLDHLREHYHIYSFFRKGVLHIGRPYGWDTNVERRTPFNRVVAGMPNLEYIRKEDRRVRVVVYAADKQGMEVVGKGSDDDGDQIRVPSFFTDRAALQAMADRLVEDYKWEGLSGSIRTPGAFKIDHGDVAHLLPVRYPDMAGKYRIKRVYTTFNSSGYIRESFLHHRVS